MSCSQVSICSSACPSPECCQRSGPRKKELSQSVGTKPQLLLLHLFAWVALAWSLLSSGLWIGHGTAGGKGKADERGYFQFRGTSSLLLRDVGLQGGEVEWASQTRATAPVSHDCWAVHLELLTLVLHPRFPRKDLALPFISFLEKPPGNTQVSPHLPQTAPVSCQFCSLTSLHSPVSWLVSFSVPSPFQTTLRSNRDQTKAPPY